MNQENADGRTTLLKRYERTRALVEGDPALARAIVCEVERDGSQGAVAVLDEPREDG